MESLGGVLGLIIGGMNYGSGHQLRVKDIPYRKIKRDPTIPKGCKGYYFTKEGVFNMRREFGYNIEIIALNDKNAVRKFNKQYKTNEPTRSLP